MASPLVNVGTGSTMTFGTSGFQTSTEVLSMSWSGFSFESIDVTQMGSTPGREFISGDLYDPGALELELHFNPDIPPPVTGVSETITLTFPPVTGQGTTGKWAASGFFTNFDVNVPLEDKMTASASFKFTSTITFTDYSV